MKWRWQPVRVFVVHNISKQFSSAEGLPEDWMSVDDFRHAIEELQKSYIFISTEEALYHIKHDRLRHRKYAVLQADDGYKSVFDQLPWLIDHKVPITLLINSKYLDGKSCSEHVWSYVHEQNPDMSQEIFVKDRYMTAVDLESIISPLVTIGSHGHEHHDNSKMSREEFVQNFEMSVSIISKYHECAPFYAYPYGRYAGFDEEILREKGFIPLLAEAGCNRNDATRVHREVLPKM